MRPVARTVCGIPLVLFRAADGRIAALLDRCPHRGVPLSSGRVTPIGIQCGYHGWTFDRDGGCRAIPGLVGDAAHPARGVAAFPVREQQGFIWVWTDPTVPPAGDPVRFRLADTGGSTVVRQTLRTPARLQVVAEQALDVAHPALLHRWFASVPPLRRRTVQTPDTLEIAYEGASGPRSMASRLLWPRGEVAEHTARFLLPSTIELESRIDDESVLLVAAACTPVTPTETRVYAVITVTSRVPRVLLEPIVRSSVLYVVSQALEAPEPRPPTPPGFETVGSTLARMLHPEAQA